MFGLVFQSWKTSLSVFLPHSIKSGTLAITSNYARVVKNTAKTLRWFLLVDLCLTAILAEALVRKINSGAGFDFILAITEVNWFFIFGSIILLIRKRNDLPDTKTYLKSMFFNYVQFLFIFMIFQLLFVGIVVASGITLFPTLHWSLKISLQIFEMLVIFYWLDSDLKLVNFFSSVENASNLVLYNLPVFIIFFGILMGLDHLLKFLVFSGQELPTTLLLNSDSSAFLKATTSRFAEIKLIATKYSKLLFEIFWLCILFAFYDKNKKTLYSKSIFEREEENESD